MTDTVEKFNVAAQSLEQTRGKARGFKIAGIKVDIMKEFRLRDVFLGENGGNEI